MALKPPNFSELGKKFNIQGLVDNVKSMVNPEGNTPQVQMGDVLGEKMASLSLLLQRSSKTLNEQAQALTEANQMLNDLFKDLEVMRAAKAKPEGSAKEEVVAKEVATDEGMPEPPKADKKE